MFSCRAQLAEVVRRIVQVVDEPVSLRDLYQTIEQDRPDLADDEVDRWGLKWRHEVRWELETLVTQGMLRRRKDLGRGMYSL